MPLERKKPLSGGLWYGARMDYTDWMWLKFFAIVGAAFVWGIWRGFIGKPLGREPTDTESAQAQADPEASERR